MTHSDTCSGAYKVVSQSLKMAVVEEFLRNGQLIKRSGDSDVLQRSIY